MKKTIQLGIVRFLSPFLLIFAVISISWAEMTDHFETATFGGGCFWCTEHDFDEVPGVISTTSGYTGGHKKNPTYQEVSSGGSGHTEVVQVVFDPRKVTYAELLDIFWMSIDPTVRDQQFCDHGNQYRSEIFYHNEQQKVLALVSLKHLEKTKPFQEDIVTEITAASRFYPAEEYHQDFHHKNPIRYKFYRLRCGRDKRLEALWGKSRQLSGG